MMIAALVATSAVDRIPYATACRVGNGWSMRASVRAGYAATLLIGAHPRVTACCHNQHGDGGPRRDMTVRPAAARRWSRINEHRGARQA
jgi:hypothetical protein